MTKRYPSDLTDQEWQALESLLPPPSWDGRKRKTDLREVLNPLRYIVRSGCSWGMLPKEFGSWQTMYWWFRRLMRRFLFRTILDIAGMLDRYREKRGGSPFVAVLDSQSVKAPQAKERGIDGNKKIIVIKRHIAVDSGDRLFYLLSGIAGESLWGSHKNFFGIRSGRTAGLAQIPFRASLFSQRRPHHFL